MTNVRTGLLLCCTVGFVACQPTLQAAPPFQPAFDKHIAAITGRDLETYVSTITTGENLPLIFPDGSFVDKTADIKAFHKQWFADEEWVFKIEPVNQIVGEDMAVALVKTSYQDTSDGPARYAYLSLVFQLQDGEWRLVQDQNTRIAQEIQE